MDIPASANPARILLVVDDDEAARAVAARLGDGFAAGLRSCTRPDQAPAVVKSHRAAVVILALPSLADVERHALLLQEPATGARTRPFLLALCSAANAAAAARLCRQGLIDDYVQHYPTPADADRLAVSVGLAARIAAPGTARSDAPGAGEARRPVVLLVEDDEVLHALVAAMLEPNIDLVVETNGAAALERIRAVSPDLVLMDVMLPGGDGVALTGQVKAAPDLAAIPVVMMTGEARLDTLVRSMEAGAADFIVKPFTRESLLAKVGKYVAISV
ncbi:MAG: response regulator [Caldimonas sp.]